MWGAQEKSEGAHPKNFGRRFAPALCPPPTFKLLPTPLLRLLMAMPAIGLSITALKREWRAVALCYFLSLFYFFFFFSLSVFLSFLHED